MKLSSIPFAALCFGLVFGGTVATSCGPSRPACTPSSCNGCCDSTSGLCVSLTTATQCGSRGETCKACSLGQSCSFGTCSGGNNTGAGTSGGGFATTGGGSSGGGFAGGGSAGGGFAGGGSAGGGFAGGGSAGGGFATGGGSSGGGVSGGGSAGGGSPGCNSGNCSSGCCQGTQCIQPPNNSLNTQCGFAGFACANCVNSGQVCNSVTFSCMPGTAGGGAGGGVGGGSAQLGDSCSTVVPLTLFSGSASTSGSLTGYLNDTSACSGTGPDAVYSVTLSAPAALTAQVFASGFTPRVSVRSSCTTTTTLGCDSAPISGVATTTTSQLSAGTYFVWVDSSSSVASGSYSLSLTASGAGGGGAGGGGVGGGFAGGGATSGSYVSSSIAASCDDMTGAMELISASTSPVVGDDVTTQPTLLPISFNFFGAPHPYASVQTNGMVQFHTSSTGLASSAYSNALTIPSSATPNGFAAPYWDDLYTSGVAGEAVVMKVLSTGGSHVTVEWVNPFGTATNFQAKFFASTGVIEYHYCNIGVATGSSAAIGVENSSGTSGAQYSTVATSAGVRFTYVP